MDMFCSTVMCNPIDENYVGCYNAGFLNLKKTRSLIRFWVEQNKKSARACENMTISHTCARDRVSQDNIITPIKFNVTFVIIMIRQVNLSYIRRAQQIIIVDKRI